MYIIVITYSRLAYQPIWSPILFVAEKMKFFCSRSRLRIWSRETGSAAAATCVSPLILHTQAESDWLMVLTHGFLFFLPLSAI